MECAGLLERRVLLRLEVSGLPPQVGLLRVQEHGLLRPPLCRLCDLLPGTSLTCSSLGVKVVQVLRERPSSLLLSWVGAGPRAACPRCPPPFSTWGREGVWSRLVQVLARLLRAGELGLHLLHLCRLCDLLLCTSLSCSFLGVKVVQALCERSSSLLPSWVGAGSRTACPRRPPPSNAWGREGV